MASTCGVKVLSFWRIVKCGGIGCAAGEGHLDAACELAGSYPIELLAKEIKARAREHILLGFQIALDHIDEVIKLIRAAKAPREARDSLIARFTFSEKQAQAIIELQLQRLTGMEREKIINELADIQQQIKGYLEILGSEKVLRDLIIKEEDKKLQDAIRIGFLEGMVDFTENLRQLVERGDVDKAVALEVAPNPEQLKMALKGIKVAQPGIL